MKYYIIAGEASGDLHGANLIKEIKLKDAQASIRFWGGDLMATQAGTPVKHYRNLAFMGLVEVLMNIKTIKKNLDFCQKDILDWKPDVLILIDYPGFNLRIAEFAHKKTFKVFYYISPKVWAWKTKRVYKIKMFVDEMFVIFPFEVEFYKKYDYDVHYIGNPLLDAVKEAKEGLKDFYPQTLLGLDRRPIIALLPGSRKQEIEHCLPPMLEMCDIYPDFQFVIAGMSSIDINLYKKFINNRKIKIINDNTYALLSAAHTAIVTSGTAVLETALMNVPQVAIYKGNQLSFFIGRKMVRLPQVTLVNLILGKEAVKEILQYNLKERLKEELNKLLHDTKHRERILNDYHQMHLLMGNAGASEHAAKIMIKILNTSNAKN